MSSSRLASVLYRLSLAAAGILVCAVVAAPLLPAQAAHSVGDVGRLFADDPAVRRAALAGAVGLAASGFVFFRPQATTRRPPPAREGLPTPTRILGA